MALGRAMNIDNEYLWFFIRLSHLVFHLLDPTPSAFSAVVKSTFKFCILTPRAHIFKLFCLHPLIKINYHQSVDSKTIPNGKCNAIDSYLIIWYFFFSESIIDFGTPLWNKRYMNFIEKFKMFEKLGIIFLNFPALKSNHQILPKSTT